MLICLVTLVAMFAGGTYNDLAASVREATSRPVVVVLSKTRVDYPSFEYEAGSLDEMSRTIRAKTGLSLAPGTDLVFHDGLLHPRKLSRIGALPPAPVMVAFPKEAVKDGKVTFKTQKNESLVVSSLPGFSKPVTVHWFYTDQVVGVNVEDQPELSFLAHLAKGIGARVVDSPEKYEIEFAAEEIRSRAIKTIESQPYFVNLRPEDKAMEDGRRTFRIGVLRALSTPQLTELFSKRNNEIRLPIARRSRLERLAVTMIQQLEKYEAKPLPAGTAGPRRTPPVLNRVDPRRQAFMIVDTFFETRVEVPVLDQNGLPAGVQVVGIRSGFGG